MTDENDHLGRAIWLAAKETMLENFNIPKESYTPKIHPADKTYARAIISEITKDMRLNRDDPALSQPAAAYRVGYNNALRDVLSRFGIEEATQ